MDFFEFMKTAWPIIVVAGGWIISVERRLTSLTSLIKTVDKMDEKLDRLVENLIDR